MMLQQFSDLDADANSPDEQRELGPTVMVSMFDDQLVICPPPHVDLEMTRVLVAAAASAVTSGATVMIDLDPDTASDELIARRPLSAVGASCVRVPGGPVAIPRAGFVRLATRDAYWTIDVAHSRLCRSDAAIDPHFVGSADWTRIQALWVTPTDVTALTVDGTYLSTNAAWTIPTPTDRAIA